MLKEKGIEKGTQILVFLSLSWIIGVGAIALAVGIQSLANGFDFYDVTIFAGVSLTWLSTWFLWRQI